MKKKTKHVGWAIVFFVFLCWASVAQTQTQKLETLTGQASGKEQLDILIQLVERHWESDPQKFLDYSKKTLDLMRLLREPNSKRKMDLLSHISSMLCALGKYSEAQTYADRSLFISKKIRDKDGEADSSINLGEIKWYLGEYRQSGDYFNEALTLFQKSKENKPGVAKAYLWIGQQNWKLGNFSMALDYVFKSTKLYEELGDKRGVANSNNMTAIIYWEMGEYEKCINRFLETKDLFMEIEDPRGVAKTTNNLGLTYLKVGE
jgi:tetratricopeptide (TPR) repeat protein